MIRLLALLAVCMLAAAEERLPVGEWLARVATEAAAEEPAWSGADAAIRLGAAFCTADHPGKRSFQARAGHAGGDNPAATAFVGFWAERGRALLQRWRSGGDLGADARWLPVLEMAWASAANAGHRGGKDRMWDPGLGEADYQAAEADDKLLSKTAVETLRRLYAEPAISAAEIALLRRFQRSLWTRCVWGYEFRPDRLGLTIHNSHHRSLGVPVPALRATPIEAVVALPGYRDAPEPELPLLWPLRADGVCEILSAIAAHQPGPEGKMQPRPAWLAAQPAAQAQVAVAAAGRPTVLFLPDAADCFAPLAYQMLAPLRAAYGDQADFVAVNVTIHDLHMAPRQFFAGPPNPLVCHPWSLGERARTARNLGMAYPGVDLPWLLDDVGSTVATALAANGGEAAIRIIDRDGLLHDAVESAFYGTIWADEVEKSLRRLLANGGRRPADGPRSADMAAKDGAIAVNATGRSADPLLPPVLRLGGTIQAVDAQAGTLTVASKAMAVPLTVRIGAGTRLQRGGRLLGVEQLKPKDAIGVEFPAAAWGGVEPVAVRVEWSKPWVPYAAVPCTIRADAATAQARAGGGGYAERGWIFYEATQLDGPPVLPASRIEVVNAGVGPAATLWLAGTVVGRDGRTLRLRQEAQPSGFGQRVWAAVSGQAVPPPEIAGALAVLARWQGLQGDARLRTVLLDDSVRLSLDGVVITEPERIPLGAHAGCAIPVGQDGQEPLRPDQVRIATPIPQGGP